MPVKAYSYIRFSNIKQEEGDSIARQIQSRNEWLSKQKNVELDTELDLKDYGVSGSARGRGKKRKNDNLWRAGTNLDPEHGNLGKFVKKCEEGEIPRGSYLILDSMDRFSRDSTLDVAYLIKRLVSRHGLKVVVLKPSTLILDEKNIENTQTVLMVVLSIAMSFEYAERLSDNIKNAWRRKREDVRSGKGKIETHYPSWLDLSEEGDFIVKPEAKKAIDEIFAGIISGKSQLEIVRLLTEKYLPITKPIKGRKNHWNTTYVSLLSKDRRLLGELQLHKLNELNELVPDGPPIPDYFPRLISDETFYSAQASRRSSLIKITHGIRAGS